MNMSICLGKGGERVRELRSKYNVGMKVFVQCLPFSILDQTPPRGQTCFYDPYNFDESLSSEYGLFYRTKNFERANKFFSRWVFRCSTGNDE